MFDEKQYKQYIETANFWVDIGERINNCIVYLSNDAHCDRNFIELVILALRSAENMCTYRAKAMYKTASAWKTLLGEGENND